MADLGKYKLPAAAPSSEDLADRVAAAVAAQMGAVHARLAEHTARLGAAAALAREALDLSPADTAVAVLQRVEAARAALTRELAAAEQAIAFRPVPGAVPGSTPGVIDPVPQLYPCGPTQLGFLYNQLVNSNAGLLPLAGGLISGNLAVGAAGTHRFDATDGNLHFYLAAAPNPKSGSMALHLDKPKSATLAHALTWHVGGVPTWDLGQDFDTNNSGNGGTGNSDFVLAYDFTANAGAGADTLRISPEDASSVGVGCKVNWGSVVGTPRANTEFLTLRPGAGVGGMRIVHNAGSAQDTLVLQALAAGNNRVSLLLGGLNGGGWALYQDLFLVGAFDLTLRDASHNLTRLTLLSNTSNRAAFGFGGGNPQAVVSAVTSAATVDFETVQRAFTMSFNDNPAMHSLNIEQIVNVSTVHNYLWFKGGLGSTATVASPTATSTTLAAGFECQDAELALVTAAFGGNVALNKPLRVGNNTLGFFGVSPVSRPAVSGAKAGNAALTSLLTQLAALGLITDSTS